VRARPASPAEVARLAKAILDLHGARGKHRESVHVRETFNGAVVWEGGVEVFDLDPPHALASRAYAWAHETDTGGRRFVAVLHIPPVVSPLAAVQVAIVAELRAKARQA